MSNFADFSYSTEDIFFCLTECVCGRGWQKIKLSNERNQNVNKKIKLSNEIHRRIFNI